MLATTLMLWSVISLVICLVLYLIVVKLMWNSTTNFEMKWSFLYMTILMIIGIGSWLGVIGFLIGLVIWCAKHVN